MICNDRKQHMHIGSNRSSRIASNLLARLQLKLLEECKGKAEFSTQSPTNFTNVSNETWKRCRIKTLEYWWSDEGPVVPGGLLFIVSRTQRSQKQCNLVASQVDQDPVGT